jgi:hypothetical protein
MVMVISPSHRPAGCYQVSIPAEWHAKRLRSRRRAHAGPGKRPRAATLTRRASQAWLACLHACIIHISSRWSSMSSQYPQLGPRQTPARGLRGRVHPNGNCITDAIAVPSRQIQATRQQQFAGCCLLRGCSFKVTYSSGGSPWRRLHSGRLSLCRPSGGQ